MTDPDEQQLPDALRALRDAVHALAGRRTIATNGGLGVAASLYNDLLDYVQGAQGTGFGNPARSMPPVVVDAVDLQAEIDRNVRAWTTGTADTQTRLWALADHRWRPQDVPHLWALAPTIRDWCTRIEHLLDPPKRTPIPAACPACGARTIHKQDTAGDTVRDDALHITPHGAECGACSTRWDPTQYISLGHQLGTIPDGVLE